MEKKVTEKLFEGTARKYDQKHINNVSKKIIRKNIINEIEANGISSEMLDKLGLPVFRYSTQVTIHGVFPDGCAIRVGGYKNLTKNGNGSLGVRYIAIDRTKKSKLFGLSLFATPNFWLVEDTSTHYALYHQERIKSEEQYRNLKAKAERINKALSACALGNVYAYAAQDLWGGLYGVILVNITAFYEKDMERVFHAVNPDCSLSLAEAEAEKAKADEQKRKEDEAQWAKYRAERAKEKAERDAKRKEEYNTIKEQAEQYATANGFKFCETFDLCNKSVLVVSIRESLEGMYLCFRRIDGKNKRANVKYYTEDWTELTQLSVYREKKVIDKMTLKNVWVKAA